MTKRIALQLYSVRDVPLDYESKVRQIAGMGYQGVETAGFPGTTPEAAAKLFKDLGLTVVGAHVPLPLGENQQQVLETLDALGKPPLVCTQIRPNDVESLDSIRDLCERLNAGYEVACANGLAFYIHNHWWEFAQVEGHLAHDLMLEQLNPAILLEVDTYWVQVGGHDPAEVLRRLGKRAAMLHIKDGPAVNREDPMVAVGDGKMNIPTVLAAAQPGIWSVVELDRCAGDVMVAVKRSYDYLAGLE